MAAGRPSGCPGQEWATGDMKQQGPDNQFLSLLLPATSLLEGQMDDGAIGHVVVSQ